jgi:hypothetical protein
LTVFRGFSTMTELFDNDSQSRDSTRERAKEVAKPIARDWRISETVSVHSSYLN